MGRNVLRVLMAGAATALLAGAAQADGHNNFYIGGSVGLNYLFDADSDSVTAAGGGRFVDEEFDAGPVISGFIGYSWDLAERGAVRLEGELAYRTNDVDSLSFNGNNQAILAGQTDSFSGLVNVYYDITQYSEKWHPYIGGGIGFAHVSKDVVYGAGGANIVDEDTVFAYQFIAGVTYKASDKFDVFVEGKYLGTDDPDLDRTGGGPGGVLTTTQESEYESLSASIGVRYKF